MYEAKCLVMDYGNGGTNSNMQNPLHQFHSFTPSAAADASRWTQYATQQLWKQHQMFMNGKSNGKDSPEKKDDNDLLWSNVEAQAAFLSPNLWDTKGLPYDTDLKYCDLDEFLSENCLPLNDSPSNSISLPAGSAALLGSISLPHQPLKLDGPVTTNNAPPCNTVPIATVHPTSHHVITKREPSPDPSEPLSPLQMCPPSPADSTLSFASSSRDFDPRNRSFLDEDLKPSAMVKKSRKQFVPDGLKDEKYWARRRKNNMAAKRSRDARRLKENQIAMRAVQLERDNMRLNQEMERLKRENIALRDRLSKFTDL